ncbi:MAG: hypothetical protein Q4Q53_03600 [Methanocorpusculum sp.]|nr:hypothetical protein [Methanocorpusculum sp.]
MTDKENTKTEKKSPAKKTEETEIKETPKKRRVSKKKETEEKPEEEKEHEILHKPVPPEFIADLKKFSEIVTANPAIFEPIREVFEYHLIDTIDRKTFPKIVNAMSMLLGAPATMVLMTACHINSAAFFEDLLYVVKDDESTRNSVWIIQHLTSLYGNRVQQAYNLSAGTMDEDWHSVDVNTFKREGENPTWIVELKLMLYNGEESHIKMTPDSALQLVDILSTELAKNVPKESVDDTLVKKCSKNIEEFYNKFYGCDNEKSEDENPAGYA